MGYLKSRFVFFIPLFIPLFMVSLSGCFGFGNSQDGGGAQGEGKVDLTLQLSSEPVTLDPTLAEDGLSLKILGNIMDGLVAHDAAGAIRLRLAEKYEVSGDEQKVFYEFVIREDAYWSDGAPVLAMDFKNAILRALDPKSPSKLSHQLFVIKNARAFKQAKATADLVGVSAQGKVLKFELEYPSGIFLEILTLPVALPLQTAAFNAQGGLSYSLKDGLPTTGMYRVTKYKRDQWMVLEKNDKNPHWPKERAAGVDNKESGLKTPERVKLQIVQDETTAVHLFEKKSVDILMRVPTVDLERFKAKKWLRTDPFLATYYLGFNLRKAPVNDVKVRRAIAAAIDKEQIVKFLGTGEAPATSWISKGLEGYIPFTPKPVESLARTLPKGLKLGLAFDSSTRNSMIVEKVQADVEKKLGIRLDLMNFDWKTFIGVLTQDPPHLFRFGWMAPFMDPITHLMAFTTGDPNNYVGWSNLEYDTLVREIAQMPRSPKREEKIRRAQSILVDREVVIIPIYHYVQSHAVSERVHDFKVSPFGIIRFDELRVSK